MFIKNLDWSASCSFLRRFFFFRTLVEKMGERDMRVTGDETQGTMGRRKGRSEAFFPSSLPLRATYIRRETSGNVAH